MLKLYAVLLGGRAPGCHIELHDMVFLVARSLEEGYPHLVNKWFGQLSNKLHIDAFAELKYIDGHEIILTPEKPHRQEKALYFVNFGGYKEHYFGEIHEINFYVASSKSEAVAKAKQTLCVSLHLQHCDDNMEIDDVSAISEIDRYYIHLKETATPHTLQVEANYRKLNLPQIIENAIALKEKDVC